MNHRTRLDQAAQLRAALIDAWQIQPKLPVSTVTEKHLRLSPEYSRISGAPNFDLFPYLREPLDCLGSDDPCGVVVFRGPIQGGKTMIAMGFVTAAIIQSPGPMLFVTATDTLAETFSKKRLDLMIRDSPSLRARVSDDSGRNKNNTIKLKRFPGGDMKLTGAQSVKGLISDTCRWVIIDEADEHRENLSYAGSSIAQAMGRTTSYGDMAKTLIVSSPKIRGQSEIDEWHDRGDQRIWEVPCPRCGEYQPMSFRSKGDAGEWEYRLVWDRGDPSSAHYVCLRCRGSWSENEKGVFMAAGRWTATRPDLFPSSRIRSFSANCLILPLGGYSWADLARQWESAMERMKAGDLDPLRTCINTRLAESFDPPGESMDAHGLTSRVEPSWGDKIPEGVRVVTTFTDVQDDRLEFMTAGWGVGWECWILDIAVIWSDPRMIDSWNELDGCIAATYQTADHRNLRASVSGIDSGHLWQTVVEYTSRRKAWRVHATKGVGGKGPIWDKTVRYYGKNKNKGHFFAVHVDAAKDDMYAALKISTPGPRYIHIPDRLMTAYPDLLDQLTSEHRVKTRSPRGKEIVEWKKKTEGRRNEMWDCLVGNLAMAHSLTMSGRRFDIERPADRQAGISLQPATQPRAQPRLQPAPPPLHRFDRTRPRVRPTI